MIKILILVSMLNIGDVNHADSVATELLALANKNNKSFQIEKIDANADTEVLKASYLAHSKENHLMLVVGEKGLHVYNTVLANEINTDKSYVYCGLHQYTPLLSHAVNIDRIALPKTELDNSEKEKVIKSFPHYTLTFAVPNIKVDISNLKETYINWNIKNKPEETGSYIIVMLPGDAPDENGVMKQFTEESATKIAQEITKLWELAGDHYEVLVENGPRTGKSKCNHEYNKGQDPDQAVDEISNHFINQLNIPKEKIYFFNFAFEKDGNARTKISYHDQLLYLAQSSKANYFVVPGESVSTIAQITLMLDGQHVIGVRPDSMNKSHHAIFDSAIQQGLISYFNDSGALITPQNPQMRIEDDSVTVADEIYQEFTSKFYE